MKARLKKVTHSNAGFGALALRNPLVLFLQHMARKNYLAHLVDMVSKEPDSGWNQLV
jgi:GTPase involved in cell partitioning and DNA repair